MSATHLIWCQYLQIAHTWFAARFSKESVPAIVTMPSKRTAAAPAQRNASILSYFSASSVTSPSVNPPAAKKAKLDSELHAPGTTLARHNPSEANLTAESPEASQKPSLSADSFDSESSDQEEWEEEVGAPLDTESTSFRPFEPLPPHTYVCPFKAKGLCRRSETFSNYRALAAHCTQKHHGLTMSSYEEDPLPDGTRKVPCPRNCASVFASHDAAMQHAKKCSKPALTGFPRTCPWPDCAIVSADSRAYATHSGAHVRDSRGLWQCHNCDDHWYDLYMLASHEMRCKAGEREPRREALARVALGDVQKASMVIVARSSGPAPKAWFRGEEFLRDGISTFAQDILDTLKEDHIAMQSCEAVLIACYNVPTRLFPTGIYSEANKSQENPSFRSTLARAHKFTIAIDRDLYAISVRQPSSKRYVLSVGIDGFACRADLVLKWLKRTPAFTLIIRETELVYGMEEEFFPRSGQGLFWGIFESHDLEESIETGLSTDRGVENLLNAWAKCQSWKDIKAPRRIGRNGDHRKKPNEQRRGLSAAQP